MTEREEREEKGFVVKDRRRVSLDSTAQGVDESESDETKESTPAEKASEEQERPKGKEEDFSQESHESHIPFPEVTFSTFVVSLSQSALLHLGEIPDPSTQTPHVDLSLAKHIIDTLGMLEEKTQGNLQPDEERILKEILYGLRMRYVQKKG
jgi:hypothetical protein